MTMSDILQSLARNRTDQIRSGTEIDWTPVAGPSVMPWSNQQQAAGDDKAQKLALLQSLMAPKGGGRNGPSGTVADTYVGGGGDFNATHEGPGTQGLTYGEQSIYSDYAQQLARAIEKRFGINVGFSVVPRNIAGTSTPSEHAYGAALDIMTPNLDLNSQIANWLMRNRPANKFDYSNILWNGNRPDDHSDHVHVGWLY